MAKCKLHSFSPEKNGRAMSAQANPVQRLWCRLRCIKEEEDGEWLPGWDGEKTDDGEWMEPIKKKTPSSGAGGRRKHSHWDKARTRRRVLTEPPWAYVIDSRMELDIKDSDSDTYPGLSLTSEEELTDFNALRDVLGDPVERPSGGNAAQESILTTGLGSFYSARESISSTSVGSLHSDDSALIRSKEKVLIELKEKSRLREDSSIVSTLCFDGDSVLPAVFLNPVFDGDSILAVRDEATPSDPPFVPPPPSPKATNDELDELELEHKKIMDAPFVPPPPSAKPTNYELDQLELEHNQFMDELLTQCTYRFV